MMRRMAALTAVLLLLIVVPVVADSPTSQSAIKRSFVPDNGPGSYTTLKLTIGNSSNDVYGSMNFYLSAYSSYDLGQQVNFHLKFGSSNYGLGNNGIGSWGHVRVEGAGLPPEWFNYSDGQSNPGSNDYFTVDPIAVGALNWNLTAYFYGAQYEAGTATTGSGNRSSLVNPDPTGAISLSANRTTVDVGQTVQFTLSSTITGGSNPYSAVLYRNGVQWMSSIFGSPGTCIMDSSFSSPGTYVVNASSFDYAGWGPFSSNSITISVPAFSGTLSLSANGTTVDVGQTVQLTLSSTITGGTPPYNVTWYENGKTILTDTGGKFSYSTGFAEPGIFVFHAAAYDSAGSGPIISNNVTITVPVLSGSIHLAATHSEIYISESTVLTLSSDLSGGTPPYNATWYENGKTILTDTGVNSSFSPRFNLPGNYTFHAVAYDSAGAGPAISNSVTIHVYGLPAERFIHAGAALANMSYGMEFSIRSPVNFSQDVTMPNGTVYSGGDNVSVNYTFISAGIKTIRSQISWNGSVIENLTFNLSVDLNVRILPTVTAGLAPLAVHFNTSIQGSSNYSWYWILMPGVTSNLSDPSETYPYGIWNVQLEVTGNNSTSGSDTITIDAGLSAFMRLLPSPSASFGTVWLNVSVISNYSVSHVDAYVSGLSGKFTVSLPQISRQGTNYSFSGTMNEFSLLAGNYSVRFVVSNSKNITNSTFSQFLVNFTFAQVIIEPDVQISGGLLNVSVTLISAYTIQWADLQISGPSGITDYNLTLSYYNGTMSIWSVRIDEYSLGNGRYSALISTENSKNFTSFSGFGFNVTVPNQGFDFAQFVSDMGGPVSLITLLGVIVMAIGVAVGLGNRGTETVYVGGQKFRSKPGKPLVRSKPPRRF